MRNRDRRHRGIGKAFTAKDAKDAKEIWKNKRHAFGDKDEPTRAEPLGLFAASNSPHCLRRKHDWVSLARLAVLGSRLDIPYAGRSSDFTRSVRAGMAERPTCLFVDCCGRNIVVVLPKPRGPASFPITRDHPMTAITRCSSGSFLRHNDRLLWSQRLAGVGGHGYQQSFFAINQVAGIERCQFETMAVGDGVCGASLDAISAEDAAVVVDVIDLGVAFGATDAVLFRVFGRLNVNAVRGARSRTQETGHALLQAVFVTLQLVQSAEAFLKNRALIGQLLVGIILNDGRRKHLPQGYGHSFGDAS
jgi:hypothetical protein